MKRIEIALLASQLALAGSAAGFTALKVDPSGLPAGKAFWADVLRTRVSQRSGVPVDGGEDALAVTFRKDASVKPEGFALKVAGGKAEIAAADFRGLMYGTGELLRSMTFRTGSFEIPDLTTTQTPQYQYRIAYCARHFHNWYEMASDEEIQEYLEDRALWGINGFKTMMVPLIRMKKDDLEKPYFLNLLKRYKTMHRLVKRLDFDFFGPWIINQSFVDTPQAYHGQENTYQGGGNFGFNFCGSNENALRYWEENVQKKLFTLLGDDVQSDYIVSWPYDEGGCQCTNCVPWGGNVYLRFVNREMVNCRKKWPKVKLCLSTWLFGEDDWKGLDKAIGDGTIKPDLLLADSHTDYPKYPLTHELGGIPIVTFPEISMWGRYPWGGHGASPQPERFTRLFNQVKDRVSGFEYYSEGLFEDINKVVVERLYWNRTPSDEALTSYARYYYPGSDPADFVRLVKLFEQNHLLDKIDAERAKAALALSKRIDAAILPTMRNKWYWRIVYCRAVLDHSKAVSGVFDDADGVRAMKELIDMYHAEQHEGEWHDEIHKNVRPPLHNPT